MMNMEIDHSNCNQSYSRARDQNNNHGLLMCSSTSGQANNLHLINNEQNLHMNQNNHNHPHLSHCQQGAYGNNICSSMQHNLGHLHHHDMGSSGDDSASPDDCYKYKLSPTQTDQMPTYKREAVDSDTY